MDVNLLWHLSAI